MLFPSKPIRIRGAQRYVPGMLARRRDTSGYSKTSSQATRTVPGFGLLERLSEQSVSAVRPVLYRVAQRMLEQTR